MPTCSDRTARTPRRARGVSAAFVVLACATLASAQEPAADRDAKAAPVARLRVDPDAKPGAGVDARDAQPQELPLPRFDASGATASIGGRTVEAALDLTSVAFDEPGDGALWARGANYKARFDGTGAVIVPFFGSTAPRNFDIAFRLREVRAGSMPMPHTATARVQRDGDVVELDHGSVREVWRLAPGSLEHEFRFAERPQPGDLAVVFDTVTELRLERHGDALRFSNEHGVVGYGAAVAIDARGRRVAVAESIVDGGIELRVDARSVAGLEFPLRIDPIVQVVTNYPGPLARAPDVAYDLSTNRFLVAWEYAFSAADHDIHAELHEADGTRVSGSAAWIDFTTAYWQLPSVANLRIPRRFLCAATRGSAPTRQTWARWRDAAMPVVMGAQFEVSAGSGSGDKIRVSAGGDPHTTGPTYWLVAWERLFNANDTDIHAQLVQSDGTLFGPTILIDNSSQTIDHYVSVSRCNGNPLSASQNWNVMFQRRASVNDEDIRFARVRWDGVVTTPSSVLVATPENEQFARPTSITDDRGGPRDWLVTYTKGISMRSQHLVLMREATVLQAIDLETLLGLPGGIDRNFATGDSDGCRFHVAWSEFDPNTGFDVWAATLHEARGALRVTEGPVAVAVDAGDAFCDTVFSTRSGGGAPLRSALAISRPTPPSGDTGAAVLAIYDGYGAGGVTYLTTSCDGFGLATSGLPALGLTITIHLADPGQNAPHLMLGLPLPPIAICGTCQLAVHPDTLSVFATRALDVPIPCSGVLVGATFAVQGFGLGAGSCFGVVRVADTVWVKIR